MKKLKLKLDGKQMLSREELKKVTGGYAGCDPYYGTPGGNNGNGCVDNCFGDIRCATCVNGSLTEVSGNCQGNGGHNYCYAPGTGSFWC